MTLIEREIVATKFRIAAECLKMAALAVSREDFAQVDRDMLEAQFHLTDASAVMSLKR